MKEAKARFRFKPGPDLVLRVSRGWHRLHIVPPDPQWKRLYVPNTSHRLHFVPAHGTDYMFSRIGTYIAFLLFKHLLSLAMQEVILTCVRSYNSTNLIFLSHAITYATFTQNHSLPPPPPATTSTACFARCIYITLLAQFTNTTNHLLNN